MCNVCALRTQGLESQAGDIDKTEEVVVVVVVIFTINMGMRDWISRHIDQFAMMTVVSACRVYLGKEKILLMIIK